MTHLRTASWSRAAAIAGWVLLAGVFATLAALASEHAYFAGDLWISHHLQRIDTPAFSRPVDLAEWLAEWPQVGALAGAAVACACVMRRRPEMLVLLLALTGSVINRGIKELVGAPGRRPRLWTWPETLRAWRFRAGTRRRRRLCSG